MKRFLLYNLIMGAVVFCVLCIYFFQVSDADISQENNLIEFFSDLAQKYYGDKAYGLYLAEINQYAMQEMTLNVNQVLLPSKHAIVTYYQIEEEKNRIAEDEKTTSMPLKHDNIFESSIFPPVVGLLVIFSLVVGYIVGRRTQKKFFKNKQQKVLTENSEEQSSYQNKDEFIIAFNKSMFKK